jgi:hypothetical protein
VFHPDLPAPRFLLLASCFVVTSSAGGPDTCYPGAKRKRVEQSNNFIELCVFSKFDQVSRLRIFVFRNLRQQNRFERRSTGNGSPGMRHMHPHGPESIQ